jgi:PAS domain S-box-containing protein
MDHAIRVLLVEDDREYAAMLQQICSAARSGRFVASHAGSLGEALGVLAREPFELVILDLGLPDAQGLEVFDKIRECVPAVPVIVLTGSDDDALALETTRRGAQDYLVKPSVDVQILSRVMRHAIERQRTARALQEREEFFRLISESMTDMVAVLDRDGRRLFNSPSYAAVLSQPEELQGTSSFEEIHPDDREQVRQIFAKTVATGVGQRAEYRFLLADGTLRYVESQGSVIRDEAGKVAKVVVVSRDMTERRRIEDEIRRLNTTLEQRVAERTAQLAAANQELQNEVNERKQAEAALRVEQAKAEKLLLNILPKAIADRLKKGESTIADHFLEVTVLFADLVGFTELSSRITPAELVQLLNQIFSAFDRLAGQHGLEKIKTIGDAYMVVGGLPEPRNDSVISVAEMALDMRQVLADFNRTSGTQLDMRVGMNTGPVIAGVIGERKFNYDLWGATVNLASRMESLSPPGAIHVTAATRSRLDGRYRFSDRGPLNVRGQGEMCTHILLGRKTQAQLT